MWVITSYSIFNDICLSLGDIARLDALLSIVGLGLDFGNILRYILWWYCKKK